MLTACDHYARTLARCSELYAGGSPELASAVTSAGAQTRRNVDALVALPEDHPATVIPATDLLDTAETLAGQQGDDPRLLLAALHALRQIDRAVVDAAIDLGAPQPQPAGR